MCNFYETPSPEMLHEHFGVDAPGQYTSNMSPLSVGPFIRTDMACELGQWGMIPPSSREHIPKTREGKRMSTNNARRERMATAFTYRGAWARGKRCLIPALSFDEPYWGISHEDPMTLGKHVRWRFRRSDGLPWALAGLWDEWTENATGQIWLSFTMITQNCDGHPILSLMHKPDPKAGLDQQDKRTPVPIERADWDLWLHGPVQAAEGLIQVPPAGRFIHGPADPSVSMQLPISNPSPA